MLSCLDFGGHDKKKNLQITLSNEREQAWHV